MFLNFHRIFVYSRLKRFPGAQHESKRCSLKQFMTSGIQGLLMLFNDWECLTMPNMFRAWNTIGTWWWPPPSDLADDACSPPLQYISHGHERRNHLIGWELMIMIPVSQGIAMSILILQHIRHAPEFKEKIWNAIQTCRKNRRIKKTHILYVCVLQLRGWNLNISRYLELRGWNWSISFSSYGATISSYGAEIVASQGMSSHGATIWTYGAGFEISSS